MDNINLVEIVDKFLKIDDFLAEHGVKRDNCISLIYNHKNCRIEISIGWPNQYADEEEGEV